MSAEDAGGTDGRRLVPVDLVGAMRRVPERLLAGLRAVERVVPLPALAERRAAAGLAVGVALAVGAGLAVAAGFPAVGLVAGWTAGSLTAADLVVVRLAVPDFVRPDPAVVGGSAAGLAVPPAGLRRVAVPRREGPPVAAALGVAAALRVTLLPDGFRTRTEGDALMGDTAWAAVAAATPTSIAVSPNAPAASPTTARARPPIRTTSAATSAAASAACCWRFATCFRPFVASALASWRSRLVSVARAASSCLPSFLSFRAALRVTGADACCAAATTSPAAPTTLAGRLWLLVLRDPPVDFAIVRFSLSSSDTPDARAARNRTIRTLTPKELHAAHPDRARRIRQRHRTLPGRWHRRRACRSPIAATALKANVLARPPACAADIEAALLERRRRPSLRVILLSPPDAIDERLDAMRAGVDDALPDTIEPAELAARLAIVEDRARVRHETLLAITAEASIDLIAHEVRRAGELVHLRPKEFQLLAMLAAHPGRAYTRRQLLDRVWGHDHDGDPRTVDVHVRWLRSKLEPRPDAPVHLVTVRGIGYRLDPSSR